MPKALCLIIVVAARLLLAFFGHNLVQAFEQYAFPVLAIIFLIACVIVLGKSTRSTAQAAAGASAAS